MGRKPSKPKDPTYAAIFPKDKSAAMCRKGMLSPTAARLKQSRETAQGKSNLFEQRMPLYECILTKPGCFESFSNTI